MILIVGGAFQGKKQFAMQLSGLKEEQFADGAVCSFEELFEKKGILHFHEYIKRMLKEEKDAACLISDICRRNPDIVVVSNELGYGVVPVEQFDRKFRETTGRVCTQAAAEAEAVYRVVCGIGTRIK